MASISIPLVPPPVPIGDFLLGDTRFPAVYFLFNRGEVVYVGQSKTLRWRIETHVNEAKKIFDAIACVPCSVNHLTLIEAHYIREYAPKYNACAVANKRRERAAWAAERGRANLRRRNAQGDCGPQSPGDMPIVDAAECYIAPHELGEFLQISDRDAAEWISTGKITDRSIIGLLGFVGRNSKLVATAQERYEAL